MTRGRLADRVVLDVVEVGVGGAGVVARPLAPLHLPVQGRRPGMEGGADAQELLLVCRPPVCRAPSLRRGRHGRMSLHVQSDVHGHRGVEARRLGGAVNGDKVGASPMAPRRPGPVTARGVTPRRQDEISRSPAGPARSPGAARAARPPHGSADHSRGRWSPPGAEGGRPAGRSASGCRCRMSTRSRSSRAGAVASGVRSLNPPMPSMATRRRLAAADRSGSCVTRRRAWRNNDRRAGIRPIIDTSSRPRMSHSSR